MTNCEEIDYANSDYGEYIYAQGLFKEGYSCEEIQELLKEDQAKMSFIWDGSKMALSR